VRTTGAPVVFCADEQTDVAVDVERWSRLAHVVLAEERVVPRYGADVEMSLLFVDETTIAGLNVRYLDGDGPTDVLAFPIDDEPVPSGRRPDEGGRGPGAEAAAADPPAVLGDVVVCPTVALRQAAERGTPADDEIALLVVHGVLHLLDYDHQESEERALMQRREQEILGRFRESESGGA
jgi:probable rRNA maturation factor